MTQILRANEVLRLNIPIDRLTPRQRTRALALANRVEAKIAAALDKGADPDRIIDKLESYFPPERSA